MRAFTIPCFLLSAIAVLTTCSIKPDALVLSPDDTLSAELVVADSGTMVCVVKRNGSPVLQKITLGLIREDGDFSREMLLVGESATEPVKDSYKMLHGKKKEISYEANRRTFHLENGKRQRLDIVFQVSNDGVAFRYIFPDSDHVVKQMKVELTAFQFSDSAKAWIQPRAKAKSGWSETNPSYEEHYLKAIPVSDLKASETGWVFPALFRDNGNWLLISETAPDRDYCASRLMKGGENELKLGFPEAVESFPGGPVNPESKLPWQTPWRFITIGSLETIVESTLGTDLAKPSVLKNIAYVLPGRASWSWVSLKDDSIVYDVQKRFIDFAAEMKWEYCLIDVNWDTKIGYDKIKELTVYAAKKGVGIILWYNSAGSWNSVPYHPKDVLLTKESRATEFARLAAMGIRGIKVDFFGGDGQSVMSYYQDIIGDAANYGLVVNCHGSTLPRGLQRTYPNLVSMEAIKGFEFVTFEQANADEQPTHCATIPFTRNVFDPMDFTPVSFSETPNITRKTSNAFELALAVLFHSGVQHYAEKPQGMRAVPEYVKGLMSEIPVSWDETQFVTGYPGKHVVIARRKGERWYVAGINGEAIDKEINLQVPFLRERKGTLVSDGNDNRSFVQTSIDVSESGSVTIPMKGNGGFVITFD
jgi:hypothetical protein